MLINFPNLYYLEEWDYRGKIRKIWLLFQLCYTSEFPSSCVLISLAIAGVGTWASHGRKCSSLSPLHLILSVCVPAFILPSLAISNWFFMKPLCSIPFCVKMSVPFGILALWHESLGSGDRLWVRVLSLSAQTAPGQPVTPSVHAAGLPCGFCSVHLESWAGKGNACTLYKFCSMSCCFSPSTCKTEITALNPSISEQCWEI